MQTSPFAGRWVADLERSARHPANQFQRAVIEFSVADNIVTLRHGYIDESGERQSGESQIQVDGKARTAENGYTVKAEWAGARAFETVATKDGQIVGQGKYEISEDGGTMTITGPEQTIILGKQRK
jgi:hypothetical protein